MEVVEGTAQVDDVEEFVTSLDATADGYGSVVQAFDARYVVGQSHLERAVELAERERERGNAIADDPGVEILLYAAGRRQIRNALEMGLSDGTVSAVIVVCGGNEDAAAAALQRLVEPAATLGQYDPGRIRSFFDITEKELDATTATLGDLVRERVAMLVVDR